MIQKMTSLSSSAYQKVWHYLHEQDPWHMIAFDSFCRYGLGHPRHEWWVEEEKNQLQGLVYRHEEMLHFCYRKAPPPHSPLYAWIQQNHRQFTTHGPAHVVNPIMSRLQTMHKQKLETSRFVVQSNKTRTLINQPIREPSYVQVRWGAPADMDRIRKLFFCSEVEHMIDENLISDLLLRQDILIAQSKGSLIGCIMRLKETPRYTLLGNLYVHPSVRKLGLASLLGKQMMINCLNKNKRICFFYSDPNLRSFYERAAFRPIGKWEHYVVTSKQTI